MDKAQKELVKSYFHARNIAVEQDMGYSLEEYEISEFVLDNNLIDKKIFTREFIGSLLYKKPQLLKYFIHKISNATVGFLLVHHPKYIEDLKHKIGDVNKFRVGQILFEHPQLIDYFKDRLSELSPNAVSKILQSHPQLIDYFKGRLVDFTLQRSVEVLMEHPELVDYFKGIIPPKVIKAILKQSKKDSKARTNG